MKKLLLALLATPMLLLADRLTISNETDKDVYVAVYYVPTFGDATKASDILFLTPGANLKLDRPNQRFGSDRQLLMLPNANFPASFTKTDFYAAGPSINVGALQAKRFYIGMENGVLTGYNEGNWQQRGKSGIISSAIATSTTLLAAVSAQISNAYHAIVPEGVTEQVRNALLGDIRDYWVSPYESVIADVRVGNGVSVQERAVLGKRMDVTRGAMQAKFGKINRAPKIAVIASGGGYRAMWFTLGFLVAAQKIGLFDMVTWMGTLSGSTWALASLLQNNVKLGSISANQFRTKFVHMLKGKSLQSDISREDFNLITNLFITDILFVRPLTLVNIYGALLANRLFENFANQKQVQRLSDQQTLINQGTFPIPIYTAVSGEENQSEYYWYAFTPWEVSMEPWTRGGNGISIPSWGYGRKYRNGQSTGYMPELSLGYLLGSFGSAFAADIEKIYSSIGKGIENQSVRRIIDSVVIANIGGKRLTWAAVPNFGRGVQQSPLRANDALQLVDAGLDFNLPYPPLSGMRAERNPEILIFVDASANIIGSGEFKKVEAYARARGLKFPKIDYDLPAKNAVTIHQDESDPSMPVVIYISRINDANQTELLKRSFLQPYHSTLTGFDVEKCTSKESCNTYNFSYSYDDAMKLSTLAEFNTMAYTAEILLAIKKRAMIAG